jgi:hypothetical protein
MPVPTVNSLAGAYHDRPIDASINARSAIMMSARKTCGNPLPGPNPKELAEKDVADEAAKSVRIRDKAREREREDLQ